MVSSVSVEDWQNAVRMFQSRNRGSFDFKASWTPQ